MGRRTAPVEVNDMVCSSCASETTDPRADKRWRTVLWIALAVNLTMFLGEIVAGIASGSRALQADALDFLGDSANYAISLGVAGMALRWRSRAAVVKGATIFAFGAYVLVTSVLAALGDGVPRAETMGIVGAIALVANGGGPLPLYRYPSGDAIMRRVSICSRHPAARALAVAGGLAGVLRTASHGPLACRPLVRETLGLVGGAQILQQASNELRAPAKGEVESHTVSA